MFKKAATENQHLNKEDAESGSAYIQNAQKAAGPDNIQGRLKTVLTSWLTSLNSPLFWSATAYLLLHRAHQVLHTPPEPGTACQVPKEPQNIHIYSGINGGGKKGFWQLCCLSSGHCTAHKYGFPLSLKADSHTKDPHVSNKAQHVQI